MLYNRRTFSVPARGRGSMCSEKGHAGADSRGDCHCCGEKVASCSRCTKLIVDYQRPGNGMSAGYYVVSANCEWSKYARPGEVQLCDACMWSDPKYIADYGELTPSHDELTRQYFEILANQPPEPAQFIADDEAIAAELARSPFEILAGDAYDPELDEQ